MEDGVECIELALLAMVELAVEKGASVILMPVSSRKQLFDLSDDLATKITAVFYSDAREAFIKAIADA
jgi:ATP-dependent Lon protease